MRPFGRGDIAIADVTAVNLLTAAQALGYQGTALVENLKLTAPMGTPLYWGGVSTVNTNGDKIDAGDRNSWNGIEDISQIWVYQNSGAPTTFGASFTGLGV